MKISLKSGVRVTGICPELLLGLIILGGVFESVGKQMTITSLRDGAHSVGSLHYFGRAADIRSHDLDSSAKIEILALAKTALGIHYDCILEDANDINEHFHLEFDPKI